MIIFITGCYLYGNEDRGRVGGVGDGAGEAGRGGLGVVEGGGDYGARLITTKSSSAPMPLWSVSVCHPHHFGTRKTNSV